MVELVRRRLGSATHLDAVAVRSLKPVPPGTSLTASWAEDDNSPGWLAWWPHARRVIQHKGTGELAFLASGGEWKLTALDDQEQHYLNDGLSDEPIMLVDAWKVKWLEVEGLGRKVLYELDEDGGRLCAFADTYAKLYDRRLIHLHCPGRYDDVQVDAMLFFTQRRTGLIWISLYPVLTKALVLTVVSPKTQNVWVHKRLPTLEQWFHSLGLEDINI